MNEPGISINEACAGREANGEGFMTDEDYERLCVKNNNTTPQAKSINPTTENSLQNTTNVSDGTLYLVGAGLLLIIIVVAILSIRSLRKRSR